MARAVPSPENESAREELHNRSVPELMRDIVEESGDLIRQEFELLREELTITIRQTGIGVAKIAAGAVLAILAVGFLGYAVIVLLSGYITPWISALIVGLAFLIAGGLLFYSALRNFSSLGAPQTVDTLKEDAEWLRHPTRPEEK